ncbi:exodeoxyribonuclease VII large subunit [Paenibacillus sp. J2TS4]|uniref:exodeoxyribonuclease VII large subunit n=1 Tax=Paenibacillus sp. J2TS4 TaxID=2807194 RepID=UPI001B22371E|nr:exodeoxyribonuclease VII large subunit [Paenibacillus sp. J2TS4]GIP32276.1 exodeoxyribonuclease 7 large subunit [Paenibacillus sp. J2TS4]
MNPETIFSVKDLTRHIKVTLEADERLQNVWVRGEISNFTHHSSGHMYFTLKDAQSRVKSIMFHSHNQRLSFVPKEGLRVLARGSISIYERDGQYQFYVNQMQPDGIGNLYLAFEQLKKKLDAEGLFAAARKRAIPRFPKAIGVITSPTGAAVRDIVTTLQRRYPSVPVQLYPVLVQGRQAAPSIVKAIEAFNRQREVDVLIVGRGGGSLEELWAFNEEIVARSIFTSDIPVISAVGHETDFTIADFVADLRAATPTAAAELAVPHHMELKQQLLYSVHRLRRGLYQMLQEQRERLDRINRSPVLTNPLKQLQQPAERLDRLSEQLQFRIRHRLSDIKARQSRLEQAVSSFNPKRQVDYARRRTEDSHKRIVQAMQVLYRMERSRFTSQLRQLDSLSPLKIMQRGYSLVYDEQEKRLIKSINQVQPGDLLKVRLTDGQLDCHVWGMEDKDDDNGQSRA